MLRCCLQPPLPRASHAPPVFLLQHDTVTPRWPPWLQGAHAQRRGVAARLRALAGKTCAKAVFCSRPFRAFLLTLTHLTEIAMASDILARVEAFDTKADELCNKGHLLRAAENYGRGAEAARALGADNLVTVHLQLRQCAMLCGHSSAALGGISSISDLIILAAHRAECIALLSGAVEALKRRRGAGDLLEGNCAAVEEEFRARQLLRHNSNLTAASAASWGTLVGYDEILRAAKNASNVLSCARMFTAECSHLQLQSLAQFIAYAAEVMQQPRRHGDISMQGEADFVHAFRYAVAEAGANQLDTHMVQLLSSALQRLQRSGVLQARSTEERLLLFKPVQRALDDAVKDSLKAPGLRCCALPGCGAKEAHPAHFNLRAVLRVALWSTAAASTRWMAGRATRRRARRRARLPLWMTRRDRAACDVLPARPIRGQMRRGCSRLIRCCTLAAAMR